MRIFTLCSLILISTNFFAQSLKIDVEWDGEKSYALAGNTFVVPQTKNFKNNFSYGDYYRITMQWDSDKIIDDSSVVISNILYEDFDIDPYSGLQKVNFNNNINVKFDLYKHCLTIRCASVLIGCSLYSCLRLCVDVAVWGFFGAFQPGVLPCRGM